MNALLKKLLPIFLGAMAGITISKVLWRVDHHLSPLDWATARGIVVGCSIGFLVFWLFLWMKRRLQSSAAASNR